MVYMGLIMSMGGLTWGILAYSAGYHLAAIVPLSYTFITPFNFYFFYKTKNFKVARFVQVLISLLLPFIFQWSLGGFISSGVVMIWAILSVIGSLSFYETKASRIWIGLFVLLTVFSWYIDPSLKEYRINATEEINLIFFTVNLTIVSSAIYILVVFFINIRDYANKELANKHSELQQSQSQLIQSEKLAALGQLIAGVAHEVNTPLGAIQASVGIIRDAIKSSIDSFPVVLERLTPENKVIFFNILQDAFKASAVLSAKEERALKKVMISKLEEDGFENADDIADTFIDIEITEVKKDYYPLLKSENAREALDLIYNQTEQCKNSDNIRIAVERASKIVFALKNYSRFDNSGEKTESDLENGLETILTLYHNQIKKGVNVKRDFDSIPKIKCFPDELNQVWTNLIHNAIHAMNNEGDLLINLKKENNAAVVNITDSGKGIPPEIINKIFDPFFTTKPIGEGSGLGLDIVKKIIDKHNGSISVISKPGETTFTVKLPYEN